jgi:hypothetical protein
MESDLSPLAEGISVTFHYLVGIMRHWDDNKLMKRDRNLGNFCLSVGFWGGHQMMGCQMPGIPSGVWRHKKVVVQTLHLGAQKLIMRELQWVFMIFLVECLLLVHEVDEKEGLLKFWIKLLHGNEVLNTSYWRCGKRMFAKRVTIINIG